MNFQYPSFLLSSWLLVLMSLCVDDILPLLCIYIYWLWSFSIDDCAVVICKFDVLMRQDKLKSFYSAILSPSFWLLKKKIAFASILSIQYFTNFSKTFTQGPMVRSPFLTLSYHSSNTWQNRGSLLKIKVPDELSRLSYASKCIPS